MNRRSFLLCAGAAQLGKPLLGAPGHCGFENITAKSGVRFLHHSGRTSQKYLPESMGAGVAMLDCNNNGHLDIFFVNGAKLRDAMPASYRPEKTDPRYWNRLFHNNGDGTFQDVTEAANLRGDGYGMGVAVGDFNNDGFPDIYVTGIGRNSLYRNNRDGTFTNVTEKAGVACSGWSTGACFVDYDRDGYLDLIVTRYVEWDFSQNPYCGEHREGYRAYCHPDQFKTSTHVVYHNNGDGTFTDVSFKCGIGAIPSKGLGIAINDFNRDGWPDVVVANDSFPEQLFRNNRDGTFTDVATETGMAYDEDGKTFAGMGIDFADYDNDGWPDVFINALAHQRYALYQNVSGHAMNYVSNATGIAGVSTLHSGWGAKLFDFDNDGWKDLFVAQGHVMDNIELTQPSIHFKEKLLLARNRKGKFEEVSGQSGEAFQMLLTARGAAFGDLNNDGSIDIAINCNDGPAVVLMNCGGSGNHWLIVNTIGTKSNRDGIGSAIRIVSSSGAEQHGYVTTAGSYLSASDKRVHFGLGTDRVVKLLEIKWPSGVVQKLTNLEVDRVLTVKEPS